MKKIILSLSVCSMMLLLSNCKDVIVEIPDANFKAYLLENFDTNNDGNISQSEADAVKEINCSGREIKDLAGIEKFTNLESLDCSNNKLDDIEVQHNKKLNKLACKGNNIPFAIYIGMSSPLKNSAIKEPAAGNTPSNESMSTITTPLDNSKCSYDKDNTNVFINIGD